MTRLARGDFIRARSRCTALALLCVALLFSGHAQAQGDGPKSQPQIPISTTILAPTYLHEDGNYNPAGTIFLPDAHVRADILAFSVLRAFDLGGRYAQIYATPVYGSVDGRVSVRDPSTGAQVRRSFSESGLADPLIIFKLGLIGLEPLTRKDMMQRGDPGFQLAASAAVNVPIGKYDSNDALNLGTNVWSLRLGAPMMIPLSAPQNGRVSTHLELIPTVTFYADNNDPTGGARKQEQAPLFAVESHLLYDFNRKWWGSIELRYVNGGETTTDGVDDGNRQDMLGGGLTLSYAFTPKVSLQGTYGVTLQGSKDIDVDKFRLKMIISL